MSGEEKLKLLKNASGLVQPVRFFEACSNTILEAMACGTPVVAFDSGSNRELVADGETGFVVTDAEAMAEAVGRIREIDPKQCRQRLEDKFSREQMVAGYIKLYEKLLGTS